MKLYIIYIYSENIASQIENEQSTPRTLHNQAGFAHGGWLLTWTRIATIASSIASKRFCFACRSSIPYVKMLLIDLPTWIWLVWGRCWQTSEKLLDMFRESMVHGFLHIKCWVFPLCFTIFSPAWQGLGSPWPGWHLHRINSYGPKKGLYLLWVQLPTAKLMFFVF